MIKDISYLLVHWYHQNKRELPWRITNEPYIIWLSEIILQQTRVAQGLPYFYRFLERYPNVHALAIAAEQDVLLLWQGLGYYSRARNMHATAKYIVKHLDGRFPDNYHELLKLKGIGNYTAAAIASFAYGHRVAVLDGNVIRVLSRLYGFQGDIAEESSKKELQKLADSEISFQDPATHNQAIMEFGALHCLPANPLCATCPLQPVCDAYALGIQHIIPFKRKKIKIKIRHFNYLVIKSDDLTYIKRREGGDIWEGLYDFYSIETDEAIEHPEKIHFLIQKEIKGVEIILQNACKAYRHILTHQVIHARFWTLEIKILPMDFINKNKLISSTFEKLVEYPKPILIKNFLEQLTF